MDAVMICNSERRDEALFEERASFDEEGDWELEFCATEDHTWAEASFNALIDFLNETDDETFRARLGEHLDVEAAIDYLVFMYAAGLNHSYAKDLVMVSYDGGPWIASVYDMEDAFGLSTDGSWADEPSEYLPELEDGEWNSGTGSVLWDRLLRNFLPEIAARYRALRQGPLSEETMCAMIVDFRAGIPEEWFALDLETYPDREPLEDPYGQILQYIPQRLALLDEIWGGQ